jgi:hypothetical protein
MSNEGDEWLYSSDAINVLDKFHGVKFIVYVEGPDDVAFWASLFDKSGITGYYIDCAGGIKELEKIISQILYDNARTIAACDAHYSLLLDNLPKHDRIVISFGHSAENTMYCPHTLNRVIKKFTRDLVERTAFIDDWYNTFCMSAKVLIVYDLAQQKYDKGVQVHGRECSRFLKSHYSYKLDDVKIKSYIAEIKPLFSTKEIRESERLIDGSDFQIRHIINGHFLTNAIINLIKSFARHATGKRPVISVDNIYALACDGCILCTHQCPELSAYEERLTRAVDSLKLVS